MPVRLEALKRIRDTQFLYEVLSGLPRSFYSGKDPWAGQYAKCVLDTFSASDRQMLIKAASMPESDALKLAVDRLTDDELLYVLRELEGVCSWVITDRFSGRPVLGRVVADPRIDASVRSLALKKIDDRQLTAAILRDPSNPPELLAAAVERSKDDPEALLAVLRDDRYPRSTRVYIMNFISLSEKELCDIVWDADMGEVRYAALGRIHDRDELARIRDTIGDSSLAKRACAALGHDYVTVSASRTSYGTKIEKRVCSICGDETEGPVEWSSSDSV